MNYTEARHTICFAYPGKTGTPHLCNPHNGGQCLGKLRNWIDSLIEFQGTYYKNAEQKPQSVLVQFDGVVLHVWHLPNPFYRLLSSDVFRMSSSFGNGIRHIKLPNGDRIETDNRDALCSIQSKQSIAADGTAAGRWVKSSMIILLCCWAVFLLIVFVFKQFS